MSLRSAFENIGAFSRRCKQKSHSTIFRYGTLIDQRWIRHGASLLRTLHVIPAQAGTQTQQPIARVKWTLRPMLLGGA
jgi:hypothetical protein